MDPYQAFLKTQVHMVDLADAYIDLIVFSAFQAKVDSAADKGSRSHLNTLFRLFTLDTIYKNRGWYLENDYMEGNKSKSLRRARLKLIQTLRPNIRGLVDAFSIPDELIYAPIALNDIS
jgi:acyl-CoA oxidase